MVVMATTEEAARSYSGAGASHAPRSYGAGHYSSGISTGRYGSYGHYAPRSSGEGQIYGSHPKSPSGIGSTQLQHTAVATRDTESMRDDGRRHENNWSQQNVANRRRLDPQTTERLRNWQGGSPGFADAQRNHEEHWRHHHSHGWWHNHCSAIVLVGGGFWGWYDGWWYPAWGYDPYYSYYDYNGPIYGYDGLQPDEVIANVQAALQQLDYFPYAVDGVLGSLTKAAIANYQRDYGLSVTGAIDSPTVISLGLGS